jgi:hypothetical protein
MDPWIRIHTNMPWIRNTARNNGYIGYRSRLQSIGNRLTKKFHSPSSVNFVNTTTGSELSRRPFPLETRTLPDNVVLYGAERFLDQYLPKLIEALYEPEDTRQYACKLSGGLPNSQDHMEKTDFKNCNRNTRNIVSRQ